MEILKMDNSCRKAHLEKEPILPTFMGCAVCSSANILAITLIACNLACASVGKGLWRLLEFRKSSLTDSEFLPLHLRVKTLRLVDEPCCHGELIHKTCMQHGGQSDKHLDVSGLQSPSSLLQRVVQRDSCIVIQHTYIVTSKENSAPKALYPAHM